MQLYAFSSDWEPAPRPTPPETVLLAIGDVHGQSAHLAAMLDLLAPVIDGVVAAGQACELVTVGDYVDRGPDSVGALRLVAGLAERFGGIGAGVHALRGNHDQFLIDFLRVMPEPGLFELWCDNGGGTTLAELGLAENDWLRWGSDGVAARLRERLDPAIAAFVNGLGAYWQAGGYLFVHAGVDPGRALAEHSLEDLLWIREPFLDATAETWPHPFTVVHGHTVLGPEVFPHRIGLDSGCFFTGVLTAVELSRDRLRFHGITSDPALTVFRELINPSQQRRFTEPVLLARA